MKSLLQILFFENFVFQNFYQFPPYYNQAKSALVHLYRVSRYDIPVEFVENLKIFLKGIKRHVAAKRMEDGDSEIVGKKKMDFKVYKKYVSCLWQKRARNIHLPVVF